MKPIHGIITFLSLAARLILLSLTMETTSADIITSGDDEGEGKQNTKKSNYSLNN